MKTLLLNLPKNLDNRFDYDQVAQPLGLACISSFMKGQGLDVTLFDGHAFHYTRNILLKYVKKVNPDLIGLSVMTYQFPVIVSFLQDLKKILPGIKVVLGGPHVTAECFSTLNNHKEVDFAVNGEGEYTMVELVNAMMNNDSLEGINGLAFRSDSQIIINAPREMINDLNSLPFPDWDSLPIERYWDVFTTKKNYARIFASRGCPYKCTFCGAPEIMGKTVRKRSPEHIIGELKLLYDKYHVREFLFNDSTFNIDNKWVREICENILKMDRPLIWRCNVRADRIDKDVLKLMKRSGCVKVIMGVESADEIMLQSMKKGETLDEIKSGMSILKEINMPSDHGFIIGMPGDNHDSIIKSINFAKHIKASVVTFSLATPFPGTAFYEQAKKEGMKVNDWSKFDFYGVPYVPLGMKKQELQALYKHAVKKFYLRPGYLFLRLKEIKSWINLKINLWFAFRILLRSIKV